MPLLGTSGSAIAVRHARLRRKKLAYDKERERLVASWWLEFDTNRSGVLEQEQLAKLLEALYGKPPERKGLDLLMRKAVAIDTTGDGKPDTKGVSKASVFSVLQLYGDYVNDQKKIDEIFAKYDTRKSGCLEPDELLPLLKDLSPGLDPASIDEADARFIITLCDKDQNAAISRDEVLPACAAWRVISAEVEKDRKAQGFKPSELLADTLACTRQVLSSASCLYCRKVDEPAKAPPTKEELYAGLIKADASNGKK